MFPASLLYDNNAVSLCLLTLNRFWICLCSSVRIFRYRMKELEKPYVFINSCPFSFFFRTKLNAFLYYLYAVQLKQENCCEQTRVFLTPRSSLESF
jgi:hypothetical protein